MRVRIAASDIGAAFAGQEGLLGRASADAMRGAVGTLKTGLRDQIKAAGLSARLANTWRAEAYPETGPALNPAGFAYSNAAEIIDAFSRGPTIRPLAGRNYLWIPTKNVPAARRRVGRDGSLIRGGKMTPDEVEGLFNAEFVFKPGRSGSRLAYIPAIRARSGTGERRATKGRRAQGRVARLILMFVLRRSVTMKKLLAPEAVATLAADDYVRRLTDNLR